MSLGQVVEGLLEVLLGAARLLELHLGHLPIVKICALQKQQK